MHTWDPVALNNMTAAGGWIDVPGGPHQSSTAVPEQSQVHTGSATVSVKAGEPTGVNDRFFLSEG